jgi:septal ring factor EnvC (AmiA/AmiB activator)
MKKLFFFLSLIVILSAVYIAVINTNGTININYLQGNKMSSDISFGINTAVYTLCILFAGIFSGAGVVALFLGIQKDKVKAYKRELEKSSVSKEANASKVDVLEAKIKTLEKAFTSVVDERTKLEVQIKELNDEIENMSKGK